MSHVFVWLPPGKGSTQNSIDVSSHAAYPYGRLSPFSYSSQYRIPVPGNDKIRADSVEGIWQGLKIIQGRTDASLFTGKPYKRGKPEGHLFGKEMIGYGDARKHIYVPAYVYHAVNNALDDVKDELEQRLISGNVALYDVESNGNACDLSRPYSHAALLVDLLNVLKNAPLPPFNMRRFAGLSDQVDATLTYRERLNCNKQRILDDVITFAYLFSEDDLKATFALRAIKKGNLDDQDRHLHYTPTTKTEESYLALLR